MSYIDITVPMRNGMLHHPAVPEVKITDVFNMQKGNGANLRKIEFGSHIGTHFDPPYHQIADGKKGDELAPDFFIGDTKVFSFLSGKDIDADDVADLDIQKGDIVLFKTPSSKYMLGSEFIEDFVTITVPAAEVLVKKGIKAVGIDYLSIDKPNNKDVAHKVFLGAGVPILEGLNLLEADEGEYNMLALFMSIENSDGGPIRVLLEKR